MTTSERPNVVLIHWHDVRTRLGAYAFGDLAGDALHVGVKTSLAARQEEWMFETNDPVLAGPVVPVHHG